MNIELISKEKPEDGLEEFQQEFLTDRMNECASLLQAESLSIDEVAKTVHNWKGFSTPYGFQTLEKIARDTESSIKSDDLEQVKLYLKQAMEYLELKKGIL